MLVRLVELCLLVVPKVNSPFQGHINNRPTDRDEHVLANRDIDLWLLSSCRLSECVIIRMQLFLRHQDSDETEKGNKKY